MPGIPGQSPSTQHSNLCEGVFKQEHCTPLPKVQSYSCIWLLPLWHWQAGIPATVKFFEAQVSATTIRSSCDAGHSMPPTHTSLSALSLPQHPDGWRSLLSNMGEAGGMGAAAPVSSD
jgi:hypothetical protein